MEFKELLWPERNRKRSDLKGIWQKCGFKPSVSEVTEQTVGRRSKQRDGAEAHVRDAV